jgi:hypothetical protein
MHASIREKGSPPPSFSLYERGRYIPMEHSFSVTDRRFPFEPNAAFGREYVDVGCNIIMTEDGCEVLNVMPTAMRLVR